MVRASAPFPWEQAQAGGKPRLATDFTYEELRALFLARGLKQGNLDFFFRGLYKLRLSSPAAFARELPLPKRLLADLAAGLLPLDPFKAVEGHPSQDGSVKYVFTLHSGFAVESVYMPREGRTTICVSSQVGCAMGCTFCATGKMGFLRQLSAGEMVGQVNEIMKRHPFPKGKRGALRVVFMGMGEPLHNLDQVMRAFHILTHPKGMGLDDREVAVSTSGLVPKIRLLAQYPRRPMLMVSLAATSNEARSEIMPVNRAYPLEELLACLQSYPLRKREKIMLSYVLIKGRNDQPEDLDRLARLASGFPALINLIPMNEHAGSPHMSEPDEAHIAWFCAALLDRGLFVTIRRSMGRDVAAACGQLVKQQAV